MNSIEKHEVGMRRTRCLITLYDLIYVDYFLDHFQFSQLGTVALRTQTLSDLTLLLHPDFLFPKKFDSRMNKFNFIQIKIFRLISSEETIKSRIQLKERQYPQKLHDTKKEVYLFFEEKKHFTDTHPRFQNSTYYAKEETPNLIHNKYLTAMTRQVYCFDSTQLCKGLDLTLLADHGSRIVVKYLVTVGPPSARELKNMFKEYFVGDIKKRVRIIHGDRSGANKNLIIS